MMFLLKLAFWLGLVILLLPAERTQRAGPAPQIGAADAVSAATAAVSDLRQFCARQAEACAVGSQAAHAFGEKAQAGAKLLYEFLSERLGPKASAAASKSPERPAQSGKAKPSQHTLTPSDLAPAWRGPPPRKDVPARQPA
jgi:hypothetical protein